MDTASERMRVLQMVEDGLITAEEGSELLIALEESMARPEPRPGSAVPPRWFRVRVTDLQSGQAKVNVNIPLGLVDVGLKMGARLGPNIESFNMAEITKAIRQGIQGKIFEAEQSEDGERVEVYVE